MIGQGATRNHAMQVPTKEIRQKQKKSELKKGKRG